MELSFY